MARSLDVRGGLGTSENAMGKERRKGKHARGGERRAKDDEDKRRDVVRRNRRRRRGVRSTRVLVRRTRLGEKSGDERDRLRHEDKQPTHRVRLLEDETAAGTSARRERKFLGRQIHREKRNATRL